MRTSSHTNQLDLIPEDAADVEPATRASAGAVRSLNSTALFAGIGGLELGLGSAGHEVSLFCERDPEAIAVLKTRFPDVEIVRDVKSQAELSRKISDHSNLVTAGFPCTDLSQAGETKGFNGKNSSLVREVLALLARRPFPHVLLENVPNWRVLHGGAYMEEVLSALEKLGYRWAYRTIDALAFGLPQRRKRVFLYATKEGDPRDVLFHGAVAEQEPETLPLKEFAHGFYWTEGNTGLGWGENCVPTLKGGSGLGIPSPPAILRTDGSVITPDIRDAEALQGFERGWTSVDGIVDDGSNKPFNHRRRWLLVGNAVSTAVSSWLGKQLARPRPFKGKAGTPMPKGSRFPTAAYGDETGRYAYQISTWPVARKRVDLERFLKYDGSPLSHRATAGFYARAEASRLKISKEFLAAVKRHRDLVEP